MSYPFPPPAPAPHPPAAWPGVAWTLGAVAAWTVNPLLWLCLAGTMGWGRDCSPPPGAPYEVPPGCPQEGLASMAVGMVLAMWILGTGVAALVIGTDEGRHRRFAYRRRTCAVLVTVAMPWVMVAYAVGNGLGRLSPVPAADSFGAPPRR